MAYKEHGMWEILDVLKRIHQGEKIRSVARQTGRSRNTVKRYLTTATELGWVAGLHEPNEVLAAQVLLEHRPGPTDVESESSKTLALHHEQIGTWLRPENASERGLTLTKVHQLLDRRGVDVSYSALYRFAKAHFDFGGSRSTVRMAPCAPGEVAEIDFGRLGLVWDPNAEKRRVVHALVVTLVYSRHQFVYITHRQKIADVIEGLEAAWSFFGGVVARVVLDNLKAAVVKADRYEPEFQRTFNEYAAFRGFVIDPCVARSPTGKPHVERQVPYVRENFFRGESFIDRDDVQRQVQTWCLSTAGVRTHGTTRKQPLAEFESTEQQALAPLAEGCFDTPSWAEPKVHPDQHIRFGNALYSVPYQHNSSPTKGKKVTVRGDRGLVRIYLAGELIKTHPTQPPGGRHTDYSDYPAEKTPYAMRDANAIIYNARKHGEHIAQFASSLLSGNFPWAHLRQAQKLLRLVDKYDGKRVDAACRRALRFDLVNVKRVERIIVQALELANNDSGPRPPQPPAEVIQLPLRFLRPGKSLRHPSPQTTKEK